MKLLVGLGNPGAKYENTRHNAGFMAVDCLAKELDFEPFKESVKHKSLLAEGQIGGEKVMLVKPLTYMNLSGRAVQSILSFYKIPLEDVLVIYDDVAIESGTLRFRAKGSSGGHNGMKSLIQELGSQDFARLRLGVKPLQPFPGDLSDYVLGQFSEEELVLLEKVLDEVPRVVEEWVKKDE